MLFFIFLSLVTTLAKPVPAAGTKDAGAPQISTGSPAESAPTSAPKMKSAPSSAGAPGPVGEKTPGAPEGQNIPGYTSPAAASTTTRKEISPTLPGSASPAPHLGINVVHPPEGYVMAPAAGQWISGAVSSPKGGLRINGSPVQTHKTTGGFLTYLPVYPGTMTLRCELELSGAATSFYRTFYVAFPPEPFPSDTPRIDAQMMQPAEDMELKPGDWLTVQMKATPGMKAQFQISGHKKLPMAEVNAALGIYQGAYQIKPGDEMENGEVHFSLKGNGWSHASATAKGRVTVKADPPPVAMIRGNYVSLKNAPNEGFVLFPLAGTKFLTAGSQGPDTRLVISPNLSGWIPTSSLQFLPPGAPPPRGILGTIKTQANGNSTVLSLGLTDNVPFSAQTGPDLAGLTIYLYSATSHTNWIIYDSNDRFVHQIRWKQEESQTVAITVDFDRHHLWGYRPYWENGSLKFELRHAPNFADQGSIFQNLNIVVDPGHMPSAPGAVGPTGVNEKDVNLAVAKALDVLLKREGARSTLTRAGDDEVSLAERPKIASERRGDLFISVHNNNLPDGANPFEYPHGFSIFYYQPLSFKLAQAVHRSYQKRISLPDEFLRYGNLLVARITEMPAVLVESAYMTFPDQEALLNTPAFQKELATAMLEGMRNFLESEKTFERSAPPLTAPPKAPPPKTGPAAPDGAAASPTDSGSGISSSRSRSEVPPPKAVGMRPTAPRAAASKPAAAPKLPVKNSPTLKRVKKAKIGNSSK